MDLAAIATQLRSAEEEYCAALKEGRDLTELMPAPYNGGVFPSPQLFAVMKVFAGMRTMTSPAMFVEAALPLSRAAYDQLFVPFAGERSVPAVPHTAAADARHPTAQGYFLSWPGVDVSEGAATLVYFHGGTSL